MQEKKVEVVLVVVSSAEFDSNRLLHFRDWFVPQDHWIELQLEPLPFEGPAEKNIRQGYGNGKVCVWDHIVKRRDVAER